MRDFLSMCIKEIAVWVTPSDDVFRRIERHLFAAMVEKPEA